MIQIEQDINVFIPVAEGQITDLAMRQVAAPLGKVLGRSITLRNDARNGGADACRTVASAACDGRTLLVATTGTHVATPALQSGLPYDARRDFVPVGFIGSSPWLLAVGQDSCFRSLAEFLAWLTTTSTARAGYFSASARGCLIEMASRAPAQIDMARYGSGHEAIDALAKGEIDFTFLDMATARAAVTAESCRALAVSSRDTTPLWPKLPPICSILEGFELASWAMLAGPAALPSSVVNELNAGVVEAVSHPAIQQTLSMIGFEPCHRDPQQLQRFVDEEANAWKRRAKAIAK